MPIQEYDDDLFKESTMSFGSHLEELRAHLFKAVLGLFVGFGFGFLIGNHVVEFIKAPLVRALVSHQQKKAIASAKERLGSDFTPEIEKTIVQNGLTFEQVLIDPAAVAHTVSQAYPERVTEGPWLGYRFGRRDIQSDWLATLASEGRGDAPTPAHRVWSVLLPEERVAVEKTSEGDDRESARQQLAAALNRVASRVDLFQEEDLTNVAGDDHKEWEKRDTLSPDEVFSLNWSILHDRYPNSIEPPHRYLAPMMIWRSTKDDPHVMIIILNSTEGFMIWMKASLIAGTIFASPWVFYQIWAFVAAGLYPTERRYVRVFLPFSIGLFLTGAALAFFVVFDKVLEFLFNFNDWLGLDLQPRMSEWISLVLWLPIGFGLSFQLPLVMLFVERVGIVSVEAFTSKWRVAVLVIFVLSAMLSPSPDPYSMCLMAIPLTLLYFLGIWLCARSRRSRTVLVTR